MSLLDLGVIFDPELRFSQHCKGKINKAYAMLGIINRNFIYLSEEAFVSLYKTLVRSHLEYANFVWNPYDGTDQGLKESPNESHQVSNEIKAP